MIEYIENVIIPYVENVRGMLGDEKSVLAIMDNFKGQRNDRVFHCWNHTTFTLSCFLLTVQMYYSLWTLLSTGPQKHS